MPKLSKADQQAKISATEAERRRKVAMAQNRLPAAQVRKVWADRLGALKDRVLMLPDRLAARRTSSITTSRTAPIGPVSYPRPPRAQYGRQDVQDAETLANRIGVEQETAFVYRGGT